MEERIRFQIELTKRQIESWKKECEAECDEQMRAWLRGRIAGLEHELNTLENLLLSWEEYQRFGVALPF